MLWKIYFTFLEESAKFEVPNSCTNLFVILSDQNDFNESL